MVNQSDRYQKQDRQNGTDNAQPGNGPMQFPTLIDAPVVVSRNRILAGKLPFQNWQRFQRLGLPLVLWRLFGRNQILGVAQ